MAKYQQYAEYKDSGVEWLGEIPSHWTSIAIKFLAKEKNSLFLDGDWIESKDISENGIRYITTGNVGEGFYKEQGMGYITETTFKKLSCTEVFPNDLLISRLNVPIGRACLVPDLESRVVTSVDNVIFRPDSEYYKNFLVYLFTSKDYFRHTENVARGATMQRISRGLLGNIRVVIPSKEEQIKIANFLDYETSKIDSLIEKQQQLIQLLKEKRQAVISHAVTKGLNPNVPMKDSGVEWLGSVPEHWNITTVRNLIRSGKLVLQDGNHGELHPTANDYVEAGIPFLMANNVRNGNLIMGDVKRISKQLADKLRIGFAKAGDMLLTHKGTVGEVALIPLDIKEDYWMLTPQVTYYRWLGKKFFNKYFYYQFQSFSIQSQLEIIGGKQSTRAYVGLIAQGDLVVAIPPINEQLDIASNILEKDKNYQLMIYKAESAIQLMQERRTALISAAVTGKIDVRNWQNPNNNNEAKTELGA